MRQAKKTDWRAPRRRRRAKAAARTARVQTLFGRTPPATSRSSPALDGVARVEGVERGGDRKRDREINAHRDRHHLHRGVGLIEDRSREDQDKIWIADKHGERGVLHDI